MTIEWYPGHMARARREIAAAVARFDVVIEVLDARLPAASANPLLTHLRGNKPCLKLLNKHDLADPQVTRAWVRHFEAQHGVKALPLESKNRHETTRIAKLCLQLAPLRGTALRPLRAMVIGIPNVGKSTLINTIAGRAIAKVGDKPGITTCQQQIDLRNNIFLCDTPGLLWPEMRNQNGAYRLAVSGAIGDNAFDSVEVALFALEILARRYPNALNGRYQIPDMTGTPAEVLDEIGRRRGCLAPGGEIDRHRSAELLLRELRSGLLGRITLETPDDLVTDLVPEVVDDDEETL